MEAWGVFVTKAWERDWKIRQIESDVKDERVVYVKKEQKRPGRHTAIYRALMNMPEPGSRIRLAGGLSGKMEHGRPAAGSSVSGTEKSTGITSMLWVIWTQAGLRMETDRSISCMTSMIIVLALCIRAGTGSAEDVITSWRRT